MALATPEMRQLAADLMVHETSKSVAGEASAQAGFYVAERLRPYLAKLMGVGGFRALLARALVLAEAEIPWLCVVHVDEDGTLQGLKRPVSQPDPPEYFNGEVALLAHLLGLLVAFIGPTLTLRLISEIWPKFQPPGSTFIGSGKSE